jgi:hypothetical protein
VRKLNAGLRGALASHAQVGATGTVGRAFVTSAAFVFLFFVALAQFASAQDQDCPNATSTMNIISCYHKVLNRTEASRSAGQVSANPQSGGTEGER